MNDKKAESELKTLYQITGNAADINTVLINRGEFCNLRVRVAELEAQLESIGAGGVGPLMAQVKQAQQVEAQKDAVFEASIDFIGTLTGMKPPPIETAPPEIFEPFRNFTERVCSIFFGAALTSRPLMKTSSQNHVEQHLGMVPAGWKLVPVEPTQAMLRAAIDAPRPAVYVDSLSAAENLINSTKYRAMLAAAPHPQVVEQPQQVEMLGETCIDGGKCHHKCTDRCFRRECCAPFSDYSGPWKYEQTQPQGEQEPDAFYEWWSMRPSLTRLQAWLLWKDQAKAEGGAA